MVIESTAGHWAVYCMCGVNCSACQCRVEQHYNVLTRHAEKLALISVSYSVVNTVQCSRASLSGKGITVTARAPIKTLWHDLVTHHC